MLIIGIDPGLGGALCLLDGGPNGGIIELVDMPILKINVNGKLRARLDLVELRNLFEGWTAWGQLVAVVEDVGARPGQSGMFAFGYVQGAIETTCSFCRIHVEKVAPARWKKALRVGTGLDETIARADQFYPTNTGMWRGQRGGKMHDRAEAAMIAKWGALYLDEILRGDRKKPGKRFAT